jgi:hypothetical protein
MGRVIVTVVSNALNDERDLELPSDVSVRLLAELVARALGWDARPAANTGLSRVEARPLGRFLEPHETLEDAGVWDGAWLIFHDTADERDAGRPASGPARAWRPLDLDHALPGGAPREGDVPGGSPRRTPWKRLSDD